jgi:hypothetical protein
MALAHYILFWPVLLTLLSISILATTGFLAATFPLLRVPLLVLWILLTLTCLSTSGSPESGPWLGRSTLNNLLPSAKEVGWKYIDRSNFDHVNQALYIWYPHGHLGIGAFGSVACGLGPQWTRRSTALAVAPPFFDIPALRQMALSVGLVRSDEISMRSCLGAGNSLVVLAGGVAERNLAEPGSMRLIDGRRGFMRLARDFKLPIIPVFSFGENELIDEVATKGPATGLMEAWHGSLALPSFSATRRFFGRPIGPLRVCLGPAFMPCDFSKEMAADWKMHVQLAYELCKPANAKPLVWVDRSANLRQKK